MPPLWPLIAIGVVAVVAGLRLVAKAPRLAKSVQAQFYGPVQPQVQARDNEPIFGDHLGLRSATWRAWGVGLCLMGAACSLVGLVGR